MPSFWEQKKIPRLLNALPFSPPIPSYHFRIFQKIPHVLLSNPPFFSQKLWPELQYFVPPWPWRISMPAVFVLPQVNYHLLTPTILWPSYLGCPIVSLYQYPES